MKFFLSFNLCNLGTREPTIHNMLLPSLSPSLRLCSIVPHLRSFKPSRTSRYAGVVVFTIIALHSLLRITHEAYGRMTSIPNISAHFAWPLTGDVAGVRDPFDFSNVYVNGTRRANAAILMLARNSEIDKAANSVRDLEDRFNSNFGYPWIFLNEEPFTEEFKERIRNITSGPVEFGLIPSDHWFQPDWVDEEKATQGRDKLVSQNIIYGDSVSYRNMCRFNSGFFYRHPLLKNFKWYWRVEPDVRFHCDISFDPFIYMEEHGKVYSFTITLYEYRETIPTLWDTVKEFINDHPEYLAPNNSMAYLSNDDGRTYNLCHFWSNFEIADLDFWRGEAYTEFFNYLDSKAGFYYERWGDAPVHSIAAALFARKDQIQFFDEIGYEHAPFTHCPRAGKSRKENHCSCRPWQSFDYTGYSCMRKWEKIQ
ncbi:Glycolipid 2-alpha-mannosyltransferase 2 [Grifola frondosa]|uniref:Glycolipid 2-alpha-mannosyltransferase 2 n=1 Tax=Grifola frondosa TaxID=5627 RepID=A0A1C7M7U1_GRIFR|nr:Glycolipid 2-alpha-mannosyltransferase 2 [Grifola frondosa]